ncbi:hypothetical protein Tco_0459421 [Tanacetum coccineum]
MFIEVYFHISVDALREEIDILHGPDDSIPPGIESDDFDSEDDDNSTSLPEFESFPVDYPDSGDSTIDVNTILMISSPSEIDTKIYDRGYDIEVKSMDISCYSFPRD